MRGPRRQKDYPRDKVRGSRDSEQRETAINWGKKKTWEFVCVRGGLFRRKEQHLDARAGRLGNSELTCLAPMKVPAGVGGKVLGLFCGGLDC